MPRIDPAQLLNCLQVLLSPTGGIKSEEEVHRLASLMTKFSKKLVSKCVYVLILKNTDRHLLNLFMGCGGWTLIQLWLHDAMYSSNWILVKEILELLILTPVDVERLKSNNIPKLVKSLSKREDLEDSTNPYQLACPSIGVCRLANQLVQQWLKIVKDETQSEQQRLAQIAAVPATVVPNSVEHIDETVSGQPDDTDTNVEQSDSSVSTKMFHKLSLKSNKVLLKASSTISCDDASVDNVDALNREEDICKEKVKDDKKKLQDKNKHRSSSSSNSKSSKTSHKDRHSSSSSSKSSKDKERSKDKNRHHISREKDKHRSNGSVSSNSSSSSKSSKTNSNKHERDQDSEAKEKQVEKDQDTLHQIQPQSLHKLPKIPKKSTDDKSNEPRNEQKGSISIEVRKNTEERPKTVKVYKSKMRSTGLEEEAKPAPPRTTKKSPSTLPTPPILNPTPVVVPVKRASPTRDISGVPPEKKTRIEVPLERPGAIKLIPPKPKRNFTGFGVHFILE